MARAPGAMFVSCCVGDGATDNDGDEDGDGDGATDDDSDGDGATDDDDDDDDDGDNSDGAVDDDDVGDDNDVEDIDDDNLPPRVGEKNVGCNEAKTTEEEAVADSVAIHTTIKQITGRGGGRWQRL